MEDDNGEPIHSYLAEAQITYEMDEDHPDNITMDELAESIRNQLQSPGCAINNTKSPATHMRGFIFTYFSSPRRGISIFGQRSSTNSSPAFSASAFASLLIIPCCSHSTFAFMAIASCAIPVRHPHYGKHPPYPPAPEYRQAWHTPSARSGFSRQFRIHRNHPYPCPSRYSIT